MDSGEKTILPHADRVRYGAGGEHMSRVGLGHAHVYEHRLHKEGGGCDEAKDAEEAMTNEHAATSAVTSLMAEQCDG